MAQLTVLDIVQAGALNTLASAAGGGDTFADDGDQRTYFEVNNGGGGSINVTFNYQLASQKLTGYGTIAPSDLVVAVGAGERKVIGPFGRGFINSSGLIEVTYSGVSSVTVGARRVAKAD